MRQDGERGGAAGSGRRHATYGKSANGGYLGLGAVLAAVWTILLLGILATVGEGIGHWLAAVGGLVLAAAGLYGLRLGGRYSRGEYEYTTSNNQGLR
jgi:hypothetical protein